MSSEQQSSGLGIGSQPQYCSQSQQSSHFTVHDESVTYFKSLPPLQTHYNYSYPLSSTIGTAHPPSLPHSHFNSHSQTKQLYQGYQTDTSPQPPSQTPSFIKPQILLTPGYTENNRSLSSVASRKSSDSSVGRYRSVDSTVSPLTDNSSFYTVSYPQRFQLPSQPTYPDFFNQQHGPSPQQHLGSYISQLTIPTSSNMNATTLEISATALTNAINLAEDSATIDFGADKKTRRRRRKNAVQLSNSMHSMQHSLYGLPPLLSSQDQDHKSTILYPCESCSKVFYKPYNLKSHQKTHSSAKPFPCQYCSVPFARSHDRRRHERLHEDQKKYKCGGFLSDRKTRWGCNRKFARADALGRHFRTDTGFLCIRPLMMDFKDLEKKEHFASPITVNSDAILKTDTESIVNGIAREAAVNALNEQHG